MKLGDSIVDFKANAEIAASLNGFKASEVLSTFDKPTSDFTIPVGVLITGLVKVLFVNVSVPANVAIVALLSGKVNVLTAVGPVNFVYALPVPPY